MFVRMWRFLKRNSIICPEVAVIEQFLPGKSDFFKNCLKKSKLFKTLPGKIDFFENLPEKIEIFQKLIALKNRNLL